MKLARCLCSRWVGHPIRLHEARRTHFNWLDVGRGKFPHFMIDQFPPLLRCFRGNHSNETIKMCCVRAQKSSNFSVWRQLNYSSVAELGTGSYTTNYQSSLGVHPANILQWSVVALQTKLNMLRNKFWAHNQIIHLIPKICQKLRKKLPNIRQKPQNSFLSR